MKWFASSVALVLCACLAWLALRGSPTATVASREAPIDEATPALDGMTASRSSETRSRTAVSRSAIETTKSQRTQPRSELLVRVIDARTQAPVAAAEVHCFTCDWSSLSTDERDFWTHRDDLEPRLLERGQRAVTDPLGEACVARRGSWVSACARAGERFGQGGSQDAAQNELVIEIDTDVKLVVRDIVVGAEDQKVEIDLRGALRQITVTAVDSKGAHIHKRLTVRVLAGSVSDVLSDFQSFADGRASFCTTRASADLLVMIPGYRKKLVERVTGNVEVALEEASIVTITFEGVLPADQPQLIVFLAPKQRRPMRGARTETANKFTFKPSVPGEHEVLVYLREDLEHAHAVEPGLVPVQASGVQEFSVKVR